MLKAMLISFIIIALAAPAWATSLGSDEKQFLKDHSQEIILGEVEFPLLENYLENYTFFLVGENQGLAYNTTLQMDLLQFLHQEAGVNYLILETIPASGEFINRYLETGDEEYLELVITYWRRSQDKFDFFYELREYNQELEEKQEIRVIGADVHGPPRTLISIKYLADLLTEHRIPLELEAYLLPLLSLTRDFSELREDPEHGRLAQTEYGAGIPEKLLSETREVVENIHQHWMEDPEPYREFLDQPEKFLRILDNILDAFIMEEKLQEGIEASHKFRSKTAYANLLEMTRDLEGEKFFGQWEELNSFRSPYREVKWLGAHLDSPESPYYGEVLSIWLLYYDCFQMQPFSPGEDIEFDSTYIARDLDKLVDISKEDLTLFNLIAPDSPFARDMFFFQDSPEGTATDYFQYLLLIQNSPPAKPFYQP